VLEEPKGTIFFSVSKHKLELKKIIDKGRVQKRKEKYSGKFH